MLIFEVLPAAWAFPSTIQTHQSVIDTPPRSSSLLGKRSKNRSRTKNPTSAGSTVPTIPSIPILRLRPKSCMETRGNLFGRRPDSGSRIHLTSWQFPMKIRHKKESWHSGLESYAHDKYISHRNLQAFLDPGVVWGFFLLKHRPPDLT